MQSKAQCEARSARAPTRGQHRAPLPRTQRRARPPRARRSTRRSRCHLLTVAPPRRLAPSELAELLVGEAPTEGGERLAGVARLEPPLDQAFDCAIELLGDHAAEERAADRRVRPEPAADEDVVGLSRPAVLVACCRPLEAEVGHPVLRARMRASVELEAEIGDLSAESLL